MIFTSIVRFLVGGTIFAVVIAITTLLAVVGCEKKQQVIDVETPGGEVKVERSLETGEIDVEVNRQSSE